MVRTMIPERIVQQYQQYCNETNFTTMSKRTLQRILDVCSASVRKSLQGLDNFSAQGCQAFDDLAILTDNLVDCGKPPEWARDVKQHLRSSKQYLKGDYKVRIIISLFCKVRMTGYFPLGNETFFLRWLKKNVSFPIALSLAMVGRSVGQKKKKKRE